MAIKVAICIPAGDLCATFFAYDLARLTGYTNANSEIHTSLFICTGSLVMKQREALVKAALDDPDTTHILWLDSDIRFPKDTLMRLLAHKVPWVCASYTERNAPYQPVAFADPTNFDERAWPEPDLHGLRPIYACGFGLMLMDVEWVRKMSLPRFTVGYNTESNTYMGEDVFFCVKARSETGTQLMLDQDLTKEVAHIGRIELSTEHALRARAAREEANVAV